MRRLVSSAAIMAVGLAMPVLAAPAAWAAVGNDAIENATVISGTPFTATEDTTTATSDPSDPTGCWNNGSVWFSYTAPAGQTVQVDTFGSNYDTVLSVWTGIPGALQLVGCNNDSSSGFQSKITLAAPAGTTYYFMAGRCCGTGGAGGGSLRLSVSVVDPPVNDNFADATPISTIPFSGVVDLTAATREPAEPSCASAQNTVWYSFTPATTESVTATTNYNIATGVYTGTSLAGLTRVTCGTYNGVTFRAQAGTTYYFQVGTYCCSSNQFTFRLAVAPDPVADFYFSPDEPSSFDSTFFYDYSYDPAGVGISQLTWDFGDGATETTCCYNTSHRYSTDGAYTARLTVTTGDGRTASVSRTVQVTTHDVALVKLATPTSAQVGHTVAINAYVRNTRLTETVRVDLYRSVAGGFELIGSLTQEVPVTRPNDSIRFGYTYTITADDGAVGKVTFEAVATIIDHHDALPGDNVLIPPPTKVA